jgi:transposase
MKGRIGVDKLQKWFPQKTYWRLIMTTIRIQQSTTVEVRLHLAFELGWNEWKLAFTIGHGQAARLRSIKAQDLEALQREMSKAKKRFGLPEDAAVVSCYEAGRDGFWLHRWLTRVGVLNVVIDSASIEVNRRRRRAKSDHLDATKLVTMLLRYHSGETKVWSVVKVPSVADEDRRRLHRELRQLKDERTAHVNRIKGLLAGQGVKLSKVDGGFAEQVGELLLWDKTQLGSDLRAELLREFERWQLVDRQIKQVEQERRRRMRVNETPHVDKVRRLLALSGVGFNGAWVLVMELFGWRVIKNRKQLGALVGLTPTPYQSGSSAKEQGISKAGNRQLRQMMVELAWCWVRWQPASELSQWYQRRFGSGQRLRKVGIVALARKLLIALWRYLERGEIPKGAKVGTWQAKLKMPSQAA